MTPGGRERLVLHTGAFSALARAMEERRLGLDRWSLVIVPAPSAREQRRDHAARAWKPDDPLGNPRVLAWDDFWAEVASRLEGAPRWLSDVSARMALDEAVDAMMARDRLGAIRDVAAFPGYRRALMAKFRLWTSRERFEIDPDPDPATLSDTRAAVEAEELACFAEYRRLLRNARAEDDPGFAVWASRAMASAPGSWWPELDRVVIPEFLAGWPAHWRAIERLARDARRLEVAVPRSAEPALADAYEATRDTRERLLEMGFRERIHHPDPDDPRPAGLRVVEDEVFRDDEPSLPRRGPEHADGLRLIGAPRGEDSARALAVEIRNLLDAGTPPRDIVVAFRRWDADADEMRRTLRSWGIPAWGDRPRPLADDPRTRWLLWVAGLGVRGWETAEIARALRNSLPRGPGVPEPERRARAAETIARARVFRDLEPLRQVLRARAERPAAVELSDLKTARAHEALEVLDWIESTLQQAGAGAPGSWDEQTERLLDLAQRLGLQHPAPDDGLVRLRDALEDAGEWLRLADREHEIWKWPDFLQRAERLAEWPSRGLEVGPDEPPPPGAVEFAAAASLAARDAEHLFLVNAVEGTFPARVAFDPAARDEDDDENERAEADTEPERDRAPSRAYSREVLAFLGLIGRARRSAAILHPTADHDAKPMLMCMFAEMTRRRFRDGVLGVEFGRARPARLADRAGTPAEVRLRAVAAALEGDGAELAAIARLPEHRKPLLAAAAAMLAASRRRNPRAFSAHEGILRGPEARRRVARDFGPDGRILSATQLESYILCPFQFFARFVLGLRERDHDDELAADPAELGRTCHKALETLLRQEADQRADWSGEQLAERLFAILDQIHDREPVAALAPADRELREIERERLRIFARRYARQERDYRANAGRGWRPVALELEFGRSPRDRGPLEFGSGHRRLRVAGVVDRVDALPARDGRRLLRVIDYKSGHAPSIADVRKGVQIQLPLYALAAESALARANSNPETDPDPDPATVLDYGYWNLKKDGFKRLDPGPDWRALHERYFLRVADRLRDAEFPVDSRDDRCTGYCSYKGVCRVWEVRRTAKVWPRRPELNDHQPDPDPDAQTERTEGRGDD